VARLALVLLLAASGAGLVHAADVPPASRALYRGALLQEAAGRAAEARRGFQRVLALDPDHRAARRALGYERVGGRWLRGQALERARATTRAAALGAVPASMASSRAYFSSLAQRSYVHDMDVEVAATSFIADPRLSVLQSGATLGVDVKDVR
jgi:hypothetical protein